MQTSWQMLDASSRGEDHKGLP